MCNCFLFVTHSYLFKPDHGHHHFCYLSCFSETSKPQHTEMSTWETQYRTVLPSKTNMFHNNWTSEQTQTTLTVDLLYLCCTYEMPETLFMSRLSCSRIETFIGTPVSCNTKPSMKTCAFEEIHSWNLFHSGRELQPVFKNLKICWSRILANILYKKTLFFPSIDLIPFRSRWTFGTF